MNQTRVYKDLPRVSGCRHGTVLLRVIHHNMLSLFSFLDQYIESMDMTYKVSPPHISTPAYPLFPPQSYLECSQELSNIYGRKKQSLVMHSAHEPPLLHLHVDPKVGATALQEENTQGWEQ